MKALLDGKEFELPEGYELKTGVEYGKELKRYLYNWQAGDLFFAPYENKIYLYLKWSDKPDYSKGYFINLDGYAKIRGLNKKRGIWIENMQVRKFAIPIQKIGAIL